MDRRGRIPRGSAPICRTGIRKAAVVIPSNVAFKNWLTILPLLLPFLLPFHKKKRPVPLNRPLCLFFFYYVTYGSSNEVTRQHRQVLHSPATVSCLPHPLVRWQRTAERPRWCARLIRRAARARPSPSERARRGSSGARPKSQVPAYLLIRAALRRQD